MTLAFIEQLLRTLNLYYTPVLIIFGCIGNIISIVVFYKSKLRTQSTSQYLSALAFFDTIFLCLLLSQWLEAVGASTLFSQNGSCQLITYLSYVTCSYSSWLVVTFTAERFVAVVYPLRQKAMCTVKRARQIIISLGLSSLFLNLPVLWFTVSDANECNVDVLVIRLAATFNLVDTVVSFTLPLAVIVILNTWIMVALGSIDPFMQLRKHKVRAPKCQRSQQRITRMLLIVSTVFLVLNLPAYAMRIVAYAKQMDEKEYSSKWAALLQFCQLCFYTNYGINFGLYCMAGQNFRRALFETFPWLRRCKLAPIVLHDNTTERPAHVSLVPSVQACPHRSPR